MKATNTTTVPAGEKVLGRVINAAGEPLDGGGAILGAPRVPVRWEPPTGAGAAPQAEMLETGLKALDLLAPVTRGGVLDLVAVAGVGKLVLLGELVHNVASRRGGVAVCAGLEEQTFSANDFLRGMAELGVEDKIAVVFWQRDEPPTTRPRVVLAARAIAEHFRHEGREVLLLLDKKLGQTGELIGAAERPGGTGTAAITTILFHPADDLSEASNWGAPGNPVDSRIAFSRERAQEGLWPAVDPRASRSRLLESGLAGEEHSAAAREVQAILGRAAEIAAGGGPAAGRSAADRQIVARARRIDLFLTQPMFVAAAFTGMPGEYVPVAETIRGFRALLDGAYDDLTEEAFRWAGPIAQAVAKAGNAS